MSGKGLGQEGMERSDQQGGGNNVLQQEGGLSRM